MRVLTLITVILVFIGASRPITAQPYERAEQLHPNIAFNLLKTQDFDIHYAYAGETDKPGVLFIHGTPGGWAAFEVYLQNEVLQRDYFMVSVDRLGWGKSGGKAKKLRDYFEDQAKSIASVMQQYPDKRWILVGHSLGASIAPKVALTSSDSVIGALLLAGSLNPKLGKPRWYNYLANNKLAKWMLPMNLGYSNNEIMAMRRELKKMNQQILDAKIDSKLIVMQGMKDNLVSPRNPQFVKQNWSDSFTEISILELPDAGHFLPWRNTDQVIQQIRKLTPN